MKRRTWLWMMSGLCLASVTARADAPLPVVAAPVALPTEDLQVDASDASTAAVWEAMQKGAISPEEAWQKGLLDAQAVQAGLNKGLAGGEDDESKGLRLALGQVLVQHAPELLADTTKLSKQVQHALADYYAGVGDGKTAPLYEAVLKQTQAPYEQGLLLEALGQFWSQKGQPQKAQEAFERGRKVLVGNNPHLAAEMLLVTAYAWAKDEDKARRFSDRAGRSGEAKQFYLQVARSAEASYAVGALHELFREELRHDPKNVEAQLVQLQQETLTPEAQLMVKILLAKASYNQQNWSKFLLLAPQVLTRCETLEDKELQQGFAPLELEVEEAQKWAQKWQTQTIVVENPDVQMNFGEPLANSVECYVFVDTALPAKLEVTVAGDKDRIKVRVEDSPWAPELEELRHQQVVVVTIKPGVPQLAATLYLNTTDHPTQREQLRVLVSQKDKGNLAATNQIP